MKPKTFMIIAGEASGDLLAAELAAELRAKSPGAVFFGAGGSKMAAAGVEVVHDMARLGVVGITDIVKNIFEIRQLQRRLLAEAIKRKPDVVIGVDYGGFNLRFGHAVKQHLRDNPLVDWKPKVVQFISPQVWASRPKRADRMAPDYDLLLSIFPFEKEWYAQRVPQLRVEFVGHPMVDRFANDDLRLTRRGQDGGSIANREPRVLLLPGSRRSELYQHLPAMLDALKSIKQKIPAAIPIMVLPNEKLLRIINEQFCRLLGVIPRQSSFPPTLQGTQAVGGKVFPKFEIQIGNIPAALAAADVAMAKTGTVTMECAFFRVPTVTFYKGSWINYQIARHYITVKTFTMANLLAGEEVYPEFLQQALTAENLARATLELLQDEPRRTKMRAQLDKVIASLGEPGATRRAAAAILSLLK